MPVSVGAFNSLLFTDLSPPSAIKLFAIWVSMANVGPHSYHPITRVVSLETSGGSSENFFARYRDPGCSNNPRRR